MIKFVNKTKAEKVYKPFAIYKGDKIMITKQHNKPFKRFKEDLLSFLSSFVCIFISIFTCIKDFLLSFVHLLPIIVIIKEDK